MRPQSSHSRAHHPLGKTASAFTALPIRLCRPMGGKVVYSPLIDHLCILLVCAMCLAARRLVRPKAVCHDKSCVNAMSRSRRALCGLKLSMNRDLTLFLSLRPSFQKNHKTCIGRGYIRAVAHRSVVAKRTAQSPFACCQPPPQARQRLTHLTWYPHTQTRLGQSHCHTPSANEMRLSIRHA